MGSWSSSCSFFSADSLIARLPMLLMGAAAALQLCWRADAGLARTATAGTTKALAQEEQQAATPAAANKEAAEVFIVGAVSRPTVWRDKIRGRGCSAVVP